MSSGNGSANVRDERSSKQAGNNLTICVFLGGLTFTALTLLLQNKDNFRFEPVSSMLYYPELLMDGMAVVSALFIIGAIGMSVLGAGREKSKSSYGKVSSSFMIGGLIGNVPTLLNVCSKVFPAAR